MAVTLRALGVGRKVVDVSVAARARYDRVRQTWDSIFPVIRLRATMPRALPSITIRSEHLRSRKHCRRVPVSTCRSSA